MRKGEGIAAAGDILVGGKGVLCCPTFKGPLSHLDRLIVYGRVEEYNLVAFYTPLTSRIQSTTSSGSEKDKGPAGEHLACCCYYYCQGMMSLPLITPYSYYLLDVYH